MMFDENVPPQRKNAGGKKTIEETYTKKTQLEHILLRPDTYVGSVEKQTQSLWVFDSSTRQMVFRPVTYVPGLYKIFDEIIVNASDNKQRDPSMNRIEVTINPDENLIRVWNNGNGIPVVMHAEHQVYVPELIFGHLLTGSNFDDQEEKTTGGRNGYGAKLANIFSKEFIVETFDSSRNLKFKQIFRDNMGSRSTPEVTKQTGTDFTCITFKPDLARFKMQCMDEDIVGLLCKRAYDIAATNMAAGSKLNVYLNGSRIDVRNFEQYIGIYKGLEPPCAFEAINERWEVGVGVSDGTFTQVSFVNGIATTKGGCHVNYIADQITSKLMSIVKKRNKGAEVKAHQIKNHLALYVNALIVNPAFDSQTKETLTTKPTSFGSKCEVPEKMIKLLEKSSIVDNVLSWAKFKQNAELKKKGGSKKSKLFGITKLDDANYAGTGKSSDCTLILTEGDSAKALAISGLGVVGRDYYGVFPLKGKLLNVREANHAQIMKNEEIQNIAKILGLTFGKEYDDVSSLRYGHLMIMTDQDHDGSHIKGLLINFLHHFWPSLLKIDGFLQQFITPIVKCTKGSTAKTFFTIPEYLTWKENNRDGKGWKIKYYKGLGTSTAAEAKDYFSNLETHEIDFCWGDHSDNFIDMAFSKKRVDDRKLWLLGMDHGVFMNYDVDSISYDDFVNHELILFSHADNERSIPHFVDGLKPSQRKVLFACFKRNLKQEIKVAQLAGYISEHSAYHHGEASLTQTIISMAQNFVGSNNINLLSPCGQFGTRLMGGKDAASPRYVFTKLESITRCIFHPHDDPLLTYLDDDGQSIEPVFYVPVIPMVLVNGAEGIGTGWSTTVPTYNPRDIIANLRLMIAGIPMNEMRPWFRGFTGEVVAKTGKESNNFVVSGKVEQVDDSTIVINELPINKWTSDYKQYLEGMIIGATQTAEQAGSPPIIKEFKENHTDTAVLFTITMPPEKLAEALAEKGGLQKKFKLDTSISTSNMNMFNVHSQIQKFESPMDIMTAFYSVRIEYYDKRKSYLLGKLTEEWEKLDNKVRFIRSVINGSLVISNRKKADLLSELHSSGFKAFVEKKTKKQDDDELKEDDGEDDSLDGAQLDKGYDYLLGMKIWSLTLERVNELVQQRDAKKDELDELNGKTPEDLWLDDLAALEVALDAFDQTFEDAIRDENNARRRAIKNGGKGKGGKSKSKPSKKKYDSDMSDDDDDDDDDYDSDFESKPAKKAAPKKPAAKPTVVSKPASSTATAPSTAKSAPPPSTKPAPKAAPASVPTQATISTRDNEVRPLSLAERLQAKSLASKPAVPPPAALSVSTVSTVAKQAVVTKVPSTKAKKAAVTSSSSSAIDLTSDNENEMEFSPVKPVAAKRAVRTAAAAPKKYALSDDDEDDDDVDEEEEEEDDYLSSDAIDDEDDYDDDDDDGSDFEEAKPKSKKSVAAKPQPQPKAKPAAVSRAKNASASKPLTTKAAAAAPANKGVKRAKKGASDDKSSVEVFSPGAPTPKATKKQKQAPRAIAAAAPKAKAAAPKKKKMASSDDEEDEWNEDEEEVIHRTPKPQRARKPAAYTSYFQDDSEEEEESFEDEDDDDDEDDDY